MTMLSIKQAAEAMGVSYWTIQALVDEAYADPKRAQWKVGKDFRNLSTSTAKKRLIRIFPHALNPND